LKIAAFVYQPKIGWPDCPTGKPDRIRLSSYSTERLTDSAGALSKTQSFVEPYRSKFFEPIANIFLFSAISQNATDFFLAEADGNNAMK
jgi:hypothetical protein